MNTYTDFTGQDAVRSEATPWLSDADAGYKFVLLWAATGVVGSVGTPFFIVGGPILLGVLQWLLLKRYLRPLNGVGWVGLTTLGLAVGPVAGVIAGLFAWGAVISLKRALGISIAGGATGEYAVLSDGEAYAAAALIAGALTGAALGALQWVALRAHLRRTGWWIPVNVGSGMLGALVIALLTMASSSLISGRQDDNFLLGMVGSVGPFIVGVFVYGLGAGTWLSRALRDYLPAIPEPDTDSAEIAGIEADAQTYLVEPVDVPALLVPNSDLDMSFVADAESRARPQAERRGFAWGRVRPRGYVWGGIGALMLLLIVSVAGPAMGLFEVATRPGPNLSVQQGNVCGQWEEYRDLNIKGFGSTVRAIDVVSANDVWLTVDYHYQAPTGRSDPNDQRGIVHWDGHTWQQQQFSRPDGRYLTLSGIYAAGASDIWVVGAHGDIPFDSLLMHRDGERWTEVDSPVQGGGLTGSLLMGISGTGPSDIWAVGGIDTGAPVKDASAGPAFAPLALHYDGTRWSVAKIQALETDATLTAVRVFSRDDAWAVGYQGAFFARYAGSRVPVVLHWNGQVWSRANNLPTPDETLCPGGTRLTGIDGNSPSDMWAVGYCSSTSDTEESEHAFPSKTLTYHWNGKAWTLIPGPNPYSSQTLYGVVAAQGRVWAVGQEDILSRWNTNEMYELGGRMLVTRWNGREWAVVPSISPFSKVDDVNGSQGFAAVDAAPDGSIWAAGHAGESTFLQYQGLVSVFSPCPAR